MKIFVMKLIPKNNKLFNRSFKRPTAWAATFILVITTLTATTGTAYAGLFSFLAPIFEGSPVSARVITPVVKESSQNMQLLQAAANPDPNPNKSAGIPPIAYNNTLVPDIAAADAVDNTEASTEISTYIVRSGDTMSGIAKMFNVSVNTILWANNITSKSTLQAGQTLVILPVSGVMYTVKKGDTVSSIAKKYGADANDISSYNDLAVSSLAVGQSIIIPDAEIGAPSVKTNVSVAGNSRLLDNVSSLPSYPGFFSRPVYVGRISQGLHGHNAVDFAAPVGTPIVASAAGTVIISRINGGWNGGYGNFVVVAHSNGSQTLYAHMQSKVVVTAGATVGQGQILGYVGMTGLTTGPHVHFEIRGAKNPF